MVSGGVVDGLEMLVVVDGIHECRRDALGWPGRAPIWYTQFYTRRQVVRGGRYTAWKVSNSFCACEGVCVTQSEKR